MNSFMVEALKEKYGIHGLYLMHGAFSSVTKNFDVEENRSVSPLTQIVKKKDDELEIGFSVGVSGTVLPEADEVKIVFHLMDFETGETEMIFDTPVPKAVIKNVGFSAKARMGVIVESTSQLLMTIEVNFFQPDFLEYVNGFAKDSDEKIEDVLSMTLVAARVNVFVEDEQDDE